MTIFSGNFIDRFFARLTGEMSFRFILQPLVAITLGIRDGILDAKAGTPPFICNVIFKPENRRAHLKSALHSLLKPITIGIIMDAIAQYLIMFAFLARFLWERVSWVFLTHWQEV